MYRRTTVEQYAISETLSHHEQHHHHHKIITRL